MDVAGLQATIEAAFETRDTIGPATGGSAREAVEEALDALDRGELRVAEKRNGKWAVNEWLKKAVLLSFRLNDMEVIEGGPGGATWWDKVPSKFKGWGENRFRAAGFRAVPGCVVRRSAYIAPGVVLMPSFVNLGAYVDSGTMVDTWATVGSCAQIGKSCHISGGAGIGGVLEPLQASPVVIEDNCFIGARAEVAEGVDRRGGLGDLDGRLSGRLHQDHRSLERRGLPGPGPGLFRRRSRHAAGPRAARRFAWPRPLLRRHREARGRTHAPEDLDQRAAPRLMSTVDPVELTQALVRCPTVTPDAGSALDLLERTLRPLGFDCRRRSFEEPGRAAVENLAAKLGGGGPHLAFCGHVDVVPPGDLARWSVDPFAGEIQDGRLYGRGAADMKSGIAAFVAAASRLAPELGAKGCALTLLITGDEEGDAVNGTRKLLDWVAQAGERFDACLVGEPTCPERLGEMAKIGRRGSLTGELRVLGRQGHTAYPQRADNAAHRAVAMLAALLAEPIDEGTSWFQPSNLQVTSIDIGNPASNVVPGAARARFNIRYNDLQTAASLERWLRERLDRQGGGYELELSSSGDAFLTEPGPAERSSCRQRRGGDGRAARAQHVGRHLGCPLRPPLLPRHRVRYRGLDHAPGR